jgi:hypothetical protein
MPRATDPRKPIAEAIAAFEDQPIRPAAMKLLATLGYRLVAI